MLSRASVGDTFVMSVSLRGGDYRCMQSHLEPHSKGVTRLPGDTPRGPGHYLGVQSPPLNIKLGGGWHRAPWCLPLPPPPYPLRPAPDLSERGPAWGEGPHKSSAFRRLRSFLCSKDRLAITTAIGTGLHKRDEGSPPPPSVLRP